MKEFTPQIKRIILYQFVSMVIFNMAHPVTPTLITTLGYPDYAFGVLFAMMSTMTFLTSPMWGRISEKQGLKKILMIGPVGSAIGQLGFGLSTHLGWTIFFRAFTGCFTMATVLVSFLYLNRQTDEHNKGTVIAASTGFTGVAMTLGYLLGGIISDNGYLLTFYVQVVLLMLLPVLVFFLIELEPQDLRHEKIAIPSTWTLIAGYIGKPIGRYMFVMFLMSLGYTLYNTTVPFYLNSQWSVPPSVVGYFMSFTGLMGLVANLYMIRYLLKRLKPQVILILEAIVLSVTMMILTFVDAWGILLPTLVGFLLFLPIYRPLLQLLVAEEADHDQGIVFGVLNSVIAVGMIGGSLVAGFAFEVFPGLPFILAACTFAFSAMMLVLPQLFSKETSTEV